MPLNFLRIKTKNVEKFQQIQPAVHEFSLYIEQVSLYKHSDIPQPAFIEQQKHVIS